MSHRVDGALAALRSELGSIPGRFANESVLFGSVVMYLHGLREEVGDIDVFVSAYVYAKLRDRNDWIEQYPREGDPPLLEYAPADSLVPIHAFSQWTKRDTWLDVRRCHALAEDVLHLGRTWRCIPLREVRRHKVMAGRAKDADDIALLDALGG